MRLMKWAAMSAAVAAAALVAACGGSGSDGGNADVRLINASAGYSSLDLTVNSASLSTGVAYGAAGNYGSVDITNSGTQVIAAGTTVISRTLSLLAGNKYSMIAYGWPNGMNYTLLQETEPTPAAGSAKLLVLNLAPDAGALSVYLTPAAPVSGAAPFASGVLGGGGSGYLLTTQGTYHVRVTGSASTDVNTDVRLDIPAITLSDTSVNTLILTPTAGGVLVNAMTVVQTGAVAKYGGNNARIRVVDSVLGAGNVPVVATRNGSTLLDTNASAPVGAYQIVAASNDAINVTVNSIPLATITPTLAAGSDYTVLVYGTQSAPVISVIADDNRLPVTNGYAKVRLINGASDPSQIMAMSLDFTSIASNVVPGSASTPALVLASSTLASSLAVTTPSVIAPVFSQPTFNIANLGVYSVYMLANSAGNSNLVGQLVKDR